MDCETNDCRKEKRGCKGCYYYEYKNKFTELYKKIITLEFCDGSCLRSNKDCNDCANDFIKNEVMKKENK